MSLTIAVLCTALFSVVGVTQVVRLITATGWYVRADAIVHILMSAVMVAMPWSWYAAFSVAAQVCVFTAAALWYVWLALFEPDQAVEHTIGGAASHHAGIPKLTYHAVMMVAMVWMALAMTPFTPSDTSHGMSMSMGGHGAHAVSTMTAGEPWAVSISMGAGILFAAVAITALFALGRRLATADSFADIKVSVADDAVTVVMAAGTSLVFLALMT